MSNTLIKPVIPCEQYIFDLYNKEQDEDNKATFEEFRKEYVEGDLENSVVSSYNNYAAMHVESALLQARELAIALGLDPEKADKLLIAYISNDIK